MLELSLLVFMVTVTSIIYIFLGNHRRRSSVEYVEDDMYELTQLRQTSLESGFEESIFTYCELYRLIGIIEDFYYR